jgi:nucleoside-diphosphate-sugar epimerase
LLNVFGGTGFVGSNFAKSLTCVLNNRDDYFPKTNNIVYFISTVDNYNVLHNPFIDIDTNLTVLMKVLKNTEPGSTFNFISSWFVYGNSDLPAREDSFCNPKGFYSITKRAAEQLLISYCETFNINYRILRLANVIGKDDKKVSAKKNALQHLINEMKEGRNIDLYEDGNFFRDYIYIDDAVAAIKLVCEKGNLNEIYNISNGKEVLFADLINHAADKLDYKGKIGSMVQPKFHKTIQVKSMYLDNTKIKQLGYEQTVDKFKMIENLL